MDEAMRKHIILLRRNRMAQAAVRFLYLCALALYVLWFMLSITYIQNAFFLKLFAKYYSIAIQRYFVFLLFSIFLLDAFLNYISTRKMLFGIFSIILLQILISNSDFSEVQKCGLQFFVWIQLAYPKQLKLRHALYAVFTMGTIVTLVSIVLSLVGLIPNSTSDGLFGLTKCSLGFKDFNKESIFICSLIMCAVYCAARTWNWRKALIAFALVLFVFVLTDSRISTSIVFVQIVATCLLCQKEKWAWIKERLQKAVFKMGIVLIPALAIVSTVLFPILCVNDFELLKSSELLFEGIFAAGDIFFETGSYHLFGCDFNQYDSLDNAYLYIAITCGLVCLVCLLILYWKLGSFLEKKGDENMSLYVALLAVRFLFDSIMFLPVCNIAILAIGEYLAIGPDITVMGQEGYCKNPSAENKQQAGTSYLPEQSN